MKTQVIALGELLIDFTMNGLSEQGNNLFEANPGGAPCNVLSMLSKLGKNTAFIGKVGESHIIIHRYGTGPAALLKKNRLTLYLFLGLFLGQALIRREGHRLADLLAVHVIAA